MVELFAAMEGDSLRGGTLRGEAVSLSAGLVRGQFCRPGLIDEHRIGPVDVEDAVEVVALVLEYDCGIALDSFSPGGMPVWVQIGNDDLAVAGNKASHRRNGKTALGAGGDLTETFLYMEIKIALEGLSRLVEPLDPGDSPPDSDLWRGYSNPVLGGVPYGVKHPCREGFQVLRPELCAAEVPGGGPENRAVKGDNRNVEEGVLRGTDDLPFRP